MTFRGVAGDERAAITRTADDHFSGIHADPRRRGSNSSPSDAASQARVQRTLRIVLLRRRPRTRREDAARVDDPFVSVRLNRTQAILNQLARWRGPDTEEGRRRDQHETARGGESILIRTLINQLESPVWAAYLAAATIFDVAYVLGWRPW